MVQLTMLCEAEGPTLEVTLSRLEHHARTAGAGDATAGMAVRATRRRFADELGDMALTPLQVRRVNDYHGAVLRRIVFRGRTRESAAYRERLRVRAAADDLVAAGVRGPLLRRELVETLGMPAEVVDAVLRSLQGAA